MDCKCTSHGPAAAQGGHYKTTFPPSSGKSARSKPASTASGSRGRNDSRASSPTCGNTIRRVMHNVVAIYCSPHPLMPPVILPFALEDMGKHAEELHAGFTLYVPPAIGRPVQDGDLLAKLYSVDHLRSITR